MCGIPLARGSIARPPSLERKETGAGPIRVLFYHSRIIYNCHSKHRSSKLLSDSRRDNASQPEAYHWWHHLVNEVVLKLVARPVDLVYKIQAMIYNIKYNMLLYVFVHACVHVYTHMRTCVFIFISYNMTL